MKILFDHCTPKPLSRHLPGHSISTAYQRGWSTTLNGDLLNIAERAGFEVFVTCDTDYKIYERTMKTRKIALIVIGDGQWPFIQPHTSMIATAVNAARIGSYCLVEIPAPGRK